MKENSSMSLQDTRSDRPLRPALGGLTPFSTVDWPDRLTATLFVAGCPWRCHYCHNPHLHHRESGIEWSGVERFLNSRSGLLDGVVISGGEPLMEPSLPRLIARIRELGHEVGLHTAGIYPQRLAAILPMIQWVGLDVKTLPEHYDALTSRKGSWLAVKDCLSQLQGWSGRYECRTTWSKTWLSEADLLDLARLLKAQDVYAYSVQRYRHSPDTEPSDTLSTHAQTTLQSMFATFSVR